MLAESSGVVPILPCPRIRRIHHHRNHLHRLLIFYRQIQCLIAVINQRPPQMAPMHSEPLQTNSHQTNSVTPGHGNVRSVPSCKVVDVTHLLSHWHMAVNMKILFDSLPQRPQFLMISALSAHILVESLAASNSLFLVISHFYH